MAKRFLVDTDWLHAALPDDNIRVYDCTTILRPDPEKTFVVESARGAYDEAHIPGAGFLDLQSTFSDQDSNLRFTLPSEQQFARAAGGAGISNSHHVVLYSTTNPMWATRMWWMFRIFGHEDVSVLDGGFGKWIAEGKPTTTDAPNHPATSYTASKDLDRVADKDKVLAAIEDDNTCVLNALSREQFRGEGSNYGRPGRIKNSENLPWSELIDMETGCFLDEDTLRERLGSTSAHDADKVITYCGGGIAASVNLFALALLGHEDKVALYDNSLSEWANDHAVPMETD